jgi:uncharacterized protein GlcG (DUF336 family)
MQRTVTVLAILAGLIGAASTHAQDAKPPAAASTGLTTRDISLDQAQAIIAAAVEKARSIDTRMDIAVVDAGGNLKAFVRMDGAWLGSIDIAIRKAKTARLFDMATGEIGKLSQPGGPLYNIEHSNGGLITFPGGIPLKASDGTIVGAIGVSGSTVENDHTVAEAGVAALK